MPKNEATIPPLEIRRSYPRTVDARGHSLTLRPMTAADGDLMLGFARRLPEEDLLFLPMDITRPEVVSDWIALVEESLRFTVLAMDGEVLAGYGSLHRQETQWTRHLGEIRLIVGTPYRGTSLGGILAREILDVARDAGLSKIVAQMPRDQAGARSVFRKLGFDLESMLADWVIDTAGNTHDLVIMAYEVPEG